MGQKKYSNQYAFYVAFGRILAMLCGFFVPIYLTRFLSKHDYGLYSQFFTLEHFLGSILVLGIPTCIYYFYPKMVGKRKSLLLNNFILLSGTALLGIALINIPFVGSRIFKNEELFAYVHIVSIYLFFFLPNRLMEPLFVVRKDKWISVLYPPVEAVSRLLCVIVASQIWGTLASIFFSLAAFQALIWVFMLFYSFWKEPRAERLTISPAQMKEQLGYSLPFGFAVILNSICLYLDRIICIGSLTAEQYAIYGMAFFTIPGIRQVYDSISLVNLTNMSDAHHQGHDEQILPLYRDFVRQVMSFSIPVVFGVCLFAGDIIGFLYTEKYLEATPFFQIHVATILLMFLGAGTILRATGNTQYTFRANLFASIVYIPLAFLLIKQYGIWGAIFASVCGNLFPRFFKIFFEIRLLKANLRRYFPWRNMGRMFAMSLICLLPVAACRYFLSPNIWICFALGVAYVLAVYAWEIHSGLFLLDWASVRKRWTALTRRFVRKGADSREKDK